MNKYLVFTATKDYPYTKDSIMTYKYIEDVHSHGTNIEEYIDSMGNVFWAVYPEWLPLHKARHKFSNYVMFRHMTPDEQTKYVDQMKKEHEEMRKAKIERCKRMMAVKNAK